MSNISASATEWPYPTFLHFQENYFPVSVHAGYVAFVVCFFLWRLVARIRMRKFMMANPKNAVLWKFIFLTICVMMAYYTFLFVYLLNFVHGKIRANQSQRLVGFVTVLSSVCGGLVMWLGHKHTQYQLEGKKRAPARSSSASTRTGSNNNTDTGKYSMPVHVVASDRVRAVWYAACFSLNTYIVYSDEAWATGFIRNHLDNYVFGYAYAILPNSFTLIGAAFTWKRTSAKVDTVQNAQLKKSAKRQLRAIYVQLVIHAGVHCLPVWMAFSIFVKEESLFSLFNPPVYTVFYALHFLLAALVLFLAVANVYKEWQKKDQQVMSEAKATSTKLRADGPSRKLPESLAKGETSEFASYSQVSGVSGAQQFPSSFA